MIPKKKPDNDSRWHSDIDRTIHEPARLMIMAYLYVLAEADFLFLEGQTRLTRGNLSSHLSKLERAGYVEIKKQFIRKTPHTILRLTDDGRKAFNSYRQTMKKVLNNRQSHHSPRRD